jgi:hypothetical protein
MEPNNITPEMLHRKAAELKLTRFVTHECEECGFKISYSFSSEEVHYNNACRCENGGGLSVKASWKTLTEEVKQLLLTPSKRDHVKQYWNL